MKHQAILAIAALAMLMIGQTVSAAPLHQNSIPVSNFIYDNFDDNTINPLFWTVNQWGGPTASETNGRVEISFPATAAGSQFYTGFYGACLLHGDFDMQVDYQLLNWPATNGVRISLGTQDGNIERVSFGVQGDYGGGPEAYVTDFYLPGGDVSIFPTQDMAGTLRLTRTGNTLAGYFYVPDLGWAYVGSTATTLDDSSFGLTAWSHDAVFADQAVTLAFDNLKINAGELICPAREVTIDIRGDGATNRIIPRSKGVISVAVMTTSAFDASTIVPSTVTFARNGAVPFRSALEDVDLDGDMDLMLFFRMENTGILCGDKEATLDGLTQSGWNVTGTDTFVTQACR